MFCGKCGKPVNDGARFCERCGNPMAAAAPTLNAAEPYVVAQPPVVTSRRAPIIILAVFAVVMALLGYEMMQFKLAGKKIKGVDVTVSPAQLTLRPGESHLIEASVVGIENTDVGWTIQEGAAGGTIVSAGASAHDGHVFAAAKYTAPANAGVYHVIATSRADESRASSATITVSP